MARKFKFQAIYIESINVVTDLNSEAILNFVVYIDGSVDVEIDKEKDISGSLVVASFETATSRLVYQFCIV